MQEESEKTPPFFKSNQCNQRNLSNLRCNQRNLCSLSVS